MHADARAVDVSLAISKALSEGIDLQFEVQRPHAGYFILRSSFLESSRPTSVCGSQQFEHHREYEPN